MGHYDTAQICLNGHVVNESHNRFPAGRKAYCDQCGAKTITACEKCSAAIRGEYHVEGFLDMTGSTMKAPSYCYGCGAPYPWMAKKAAAAEAMAAELEGLTEPERIELK